MKIGIDASVLIPALHANHPSHAAAARWLSRQMGTHDLVVAQHSVIGCFAVLTRLPGVLRLSAEEARHVLADTVQDHMTVAALTAHATWTIADALAAGSVTGGRVYDALVIATLRAAHVEAIATFNVSHFKELAPDMRIIVP